MASTALRVGLLALLFPAAACNLFSSGTVTQPVEGCGDGIVSGLEICDDGNTAPNDGCAADCMSDEQCGNGVEDENELCDDSNTLDGDGCNASCTSDEQCGNGFLDVINGETCDDGNATANDMCSANCQSNEQCGNNVTDTPVGEECDDGGISADCDTNCTLAICGDGTRNSLAGEACDTSGVFTNNCDTDCTTPSCGDGLRNPVREACDTGDASATCDADCSLATCGDGTVNAAANEECDGGQGSANTLACDGDCTLVVCGDNVTNTVAGEECDDANGDNSDACIDDCNTARCGDGHVYAGMEECDDSNTMSGDGCSDACVWETRVYTMALGNLFNQDGTCAAGDVDDRTDACNGAEFGFTWTDTTPFSPSSVQIEVTYGYDCSGGAYTRGTDLNGTGTGDLSINGDRCTCDPAVQLLTVSAPVASLDRNATNRFTIAGDGVGTCGGLSDRGSGYARVIVVP